MHLLVSLVFVAGCMVGEDVGSVALPPTIPHDVFDPLKPAAEAHAELCDHEPGDTTFPDRADRITNRFCQDVKPGGAMPTPHGLDELLALLDLDFKDPTGGNGVGGNPAFALLGHSSALTARKVSTITPTAFVFTPLGPDGKPPADYMFLAFDPGEQFVEIASFSPADQAVNFYLLLFDKQCGASCGPNDLLTPDLTTGWSNIRIYESTTTLGNTIADCRQCHIGTGRDVPETGDPLILRMQELEAPHTHWFSAATEGGSALLSDFHAAHGTDESYGGVPAALIDKSDPDLMADFIKAAGFAAQPNEFHSEAIEREVKGAAPQQPAINVPMGASSTWLTAFDAATAGAAIPVPYHDVKITDPDKLAVATSAYQHYRQGERLTLDIRDVFLDDGLVEMGFAGAPELSGRELLVQQCQQCHHERLDPTVSRDRFLVDRLDQMSRAEKELAIERIQMSIDTVLSMPPPLLRSLGQRERDLMIAELRR